jgi:lysophospholipase L1-like esterase
MKATVFSVQLRRLMVPIAMAVAGFSACLSKGAERLHVMIAADDQRLCYAGYVSLQFIDGIEEALPRAAQFERKLDTLGKGYRWDSPGTRVRFRTDAVFLQAMLYYNERHVSASARNSVGFFVINGVRKPEWRFQTRQRDIVRKPELVNVAIPGNYPPCFRDYELILPYGDSVDFAGLYVNPEARFETASSGSTVRYLAYGDSITHGFSASDVSNTYPFLIGSDKKWEVINLGLGGRMSTADDGTFIAELHPDIITVLIGVNDWQRGISVDCYRDNMKAFISNIRTKQPVVPIYLITPLWVDPAWRPSNHVTTDLDKYRQVLRELVTLRNDPNLRLIEGLGLIDHDAYYFDRVAVHPNDSGFAMMARRLADQMREPQPTP